MKDIEIRTVIRSCQYGELSEEDRELVDAARAMTDHAYAPYSHFHVGAAIRMSNGAIETGSNQENAAFPSGLCAERTACFSASSRHPGEAMKKIAIAAREEGSASYLRQPITPCGGCRQALMEYENLHGPIEVILYGEEQVYILPSIGSLLPLSFKL